MSIVNHLPRACAGPGKRPGILAADFSNPEGRQVNSIGFPPEQAIIVTPRKARVQGQRRDPGLADARGRDVLLLAMRAAACGLDYRRPPPDARNQRPDCACDSTRSLCSTIQASAAFLVENGLTFVG